MVIAYATLLAAWVVTNPPGFAPDEPAHYVKAVGAGRADLLGEPASSRHLPVVDPVMLQWLNRTSRSMAVPASLRSCPAFRLPVYGRCPEGRPPAAAGREISYVGTYPPYVYVWPGLVMRPASSSYSALVLGRAAMAALSLGLVSAAAWVLWWHRRSLWSLQGLVVAMTPMVVFAGSELSASGPEIAAGICFAACLLRLAGEESEPYSRRLWAVALVSGMILASARSTGPVWVAADLIWFTALGGPGRWKTLAGAHGRWAGVTVGGIGAAVLATVIWEMLLEPHAALDPQTVMAGVGSGLTGMGDVLRQCVGVFGWVDVPMSAIAYFVWAGMLAALVAVALVVGRPRERLLLGLLAAGILVTTVGLAVLVRATGAGFAMQGRYVLALAVTFPMMAGEIVQRNRHRLRCRLWPLTLLLPAAAGAVQLAAWASNGRYYMTNTGGWLSFIEPLSWNPPLGWLLWAVVVCLAAIGLAATGLAARVQAL